MGICDLTLGLRKGKERNLRKRCISCYFKKEEAKKSLKQIYLCYYRDILGISQKSLRNTLQLIEINIKLKKFSINLLCLL